MAPTLRPRWRIRRSRSAPSAKSMPRSPPASSARPTSSRTASLSGAWIASRCWSGGSSPGAGELGLDPIEPAGGGFLHHVEHPLEAFHAAVVRVGNVLALPAGTLIEEEAQSRPCMAGREAREDA